MYAARLILIVITINLYGCQNVEYGGRLNTKQVLLSSLKEAENTDLSLNDRLTYAMKADTIAAKYSDDTQRVECLRLIATLNLKLNNSSLARQYFQKTMELARKLGDNENLGIAINNIGLIFQEASAYDSALHYYSQAVEIFRRQRNELRIAQGLANLATIHKIRGNYKEAFEASLEAAKIIEIKGTKRDLSDAYTTLGAISKDLRRYEESLDYHERALQLRREEKDSSGMAGSLNNMGNVFRYKRDFKNALHYYQASLKLKEKSGTPKTIAVTIDNIAQTYFELHQFSVAESYFEKAFELRKMSNDVDGMLTTGNRLCELYLMRRETNKAEKLITQISQYIPSGKYLKQRLDNTLLRAKLHAQSRQYKQAHDYLDNALRLKDSIFNKEIARTISQMQVAFNTEEKERGLIHGRQIQAVQLSKIHTQQIFITLLVILLVTLAYTLWKLYRSNINILAANQKIEFLMRELNHRVKNNLQLISDLLHMQKNTVKDEKQRGIMQTAISRVETISAIHTLLYKKNSNGIINIRLFLTELINSINYSYENFSKQFNVSINIQDIEIDNESAVSIGLIVNELITNLYKYSKPSTDIPALSISFSFIEHEEHYRLEIKDNCQPWNFQQSRLTKNGIGLYLVENLIKQLNGQWRYFRNEEHSLHLIILK